MTIESPSPFTVSLSWRGAAVKVENIGTVDDMATALGFRLMAMIDNAYLTLRSRSLTLTKYRAIGE